MKLLRMGIRSLFEMLMVRRFFQPKVSDLTWSSFMSTLRLGFSMLNVVGRGSVALENIFAPKRDEYSRTSDWASAGEMAKLGLPALTSLSAKILSTAAASELASDIGSGFHLVNSYGSYWEFL